MKSLSIVFAALFSLSAFADPCTYLTKRQCQYERQYCTYEQGYRQDARCDVKESDIGNTVQETMCKVPNGAFWVTKSDQERQNICLQYGCEWQPKEQEPSGCFLRDDLFN